METNATPEFKTLHSNVRKLVKDTLNPSFEKVEKKARIPEEMIEKFREFLLMNTLRPLRISFGEPMLELCSGLMQVKG